MKIFSGSSNPNLAKGIAKYLGVSLSKINVQKFADGELGIKIEENVRGSEVFLIKSTSTPVNDNIMETLLIIDALKRASAKSITLINPYYGYARQDRKHEPRVPISAALVAKLLETSGVDRYVGLDLHCGQIQGFLNISSDNLSAARCLALNFIKKTKNVKSLCVVSPDAGGAKRAQKFKTILEGELSDEVNVSSAIMNKVREKANQVEKMELVGVVKDSDCVIFDDMIDTAGTLCKAAEVLKSNGAKRIFCCASHGLFNGNALENIEKSAIELVIVTDSIQQDLEKISKITKKITTVTLSSLLGEAIRRMHNGESISQMDC